MSVNDNKRYYWLRLKEDFFTSLRIKKLRNLSADFVIIYLKLQLKSLKNEGKLFYSGLEDNFAKELALELDEDVDKVQVTLSYLQACGLLETTDNEIFLPYVEELTGNETNGAVRKRVSRALENSTNQLDLGTTSGQLGTNGGHCPLEKEIDKDIEIYKEKENIKKKKNSFEEIINSFTDNEELKDTIKAYLEMRKKEKGFTPYALQLNLNKLKKMSSDENIQVQIVNQSIEHSWKAFYELQEMKFKNTFQKTQIVNKVPTYDEIKPDSKVTKEKIDEQLDRLLKRRTERKKNKEDLW